MTLSKPVSTQSGWRIVRETEGNGRFATFQGVLMPRVQDGLQGKAARAAVLAHIKALRKLGYTRVNTRDIAEALGMSRPLVEQAVTQLKGEGVKVAK